MTPDPEKHFRDSLSRAEEIRLDPPWNAEGDLEAEEEILEARADARRKGE